MKPNHPLLVFDGSAVIQVNEQKHLGLILESGFSFKKHLNEKMINTKELLDFLYTSPNIYLQRHLIKCTIMGTERKHFHIFKIINGKLGIKHSTFSKFNTSATRGHKQKLFKQKATKTVRSQSFSHRVTNDWNGLSSEVINAATANEFKNNLGKFWQLQLYETPF